MFHFLPAMNDQKASGIAPLAFLLSRRELQPDDPDKDK
jgi:hypothetical protein